MLAEPRAGGKAARGGFALGTASWLVGFGFVLFFLKSRVEFLAEKEREKPHPRIASSLMGMASAGCSAVSCGSGQGLPPPTVLPLSPCPRKGHKGFPHAAPVFFARVGLKCCLKRRGEHFPPGWGHQTAPARSCRVLLRFSRREVMAAVAGSGLRPESSLGACKQGAFTF